MFHIHISGQPTVKSKLLVEISFNLFPSYEDALMYFPSHLRFSRFFSLVSLREPLELNFGSSADTMFLAK